MNTKMEQFPAKNPNPVLSVAKNGTVLYSNEAGEPLLREWGVAFGEKLPSYIEDIVQKVISRNIQEKTEVYVGKKVYMTLFHPLPDEECVNIYGFDISEQKELEKKLRESEDKYRDIIETAIEGIWILDNELRTKYVNKKIAEIFGYSQEEMIDRFPWDFTDEEGKNVIKLNMEKRRQGISEILDTKYIRSDGSSLWAQVSSKSLIDKNGKFTGVLGMLTDITERKQAEEEVKNARNMLQLIMNYIPQGIFWKDRNSRYMGCNQVFAKASGIGSPENIVGKTDYDLPWSPEQTEWFREYDRMTMENDTPEYQIVEPQREADGKLVWVETNKIPLHDAKGNVIGILGTYEDITERKRLEETLRESEEKYRNIIELANEGIWLVDAETKITYTNQKMAEMLRYSQEELIGRLATDFVDENYKAYAEVRMEKRRQGIDETHENKFVRKDGSTLWVLVNSKSLFDKDGEFTGVLAMLTDITERKQAEQELRLSVERLDLALDASNAGIWEWDLQTDENIWSPELWKLYGLEPYSCKPSYESWRKTIIPSERESVERRVQEAATSGSELNIEWRVIDPDGSERWLMSRGRLLSDAHSQMDSYIGIVVDITERKKVEEALREANEKLQTQSEELQVSNEELRVQSDELTEANVLLHDRVTGFSTLAENSPDLVARFDRQNNCIYANPAAKFHDIPVIKEFHGWSVNELIDKANPELRVNPTWAKSSDKVRKNVFITGKPETMEFQYISSQGKKYYFDTKVIPELVNKEVVSVLVISRDITVIKETEVKLKETLVNLEEKVTQRTSELEEAYKLSLENERRFNEAQKMAHIGSWDLDIETGEVYWSDETYRIFGRNPQEFSATYDAFLSFVHPDDHDYADNKVKEALKGKPNEIEYRIISDDGAERIIHAQGEVIFNEENTPVRMRGTVQDITERKKTEEVMVNIETARKQEIHHRIKNNLQVISSLLDLQAETFKCRKDIKDSEVLKAFRESQDRVISMALIHEELYKGGGVEKLNFSPYIEELANNLFLTYKLGDTDVILNLDLEENLYFDMDTAVPLGIIVNELVSNSLKHAFTGREKGEIRIQLHRDESESDEGAIFTLTISDNGVGIPENIDIEELDSLGLQLVTSLVDQLDGELELKRDNGTEFTIKFTVTEKE